MMDEKEEMRMIEEMTSVNVKDCYWIRLDYDALHKECYLFGDNRK